MESLDELVKHYKDQFDTIKWYDKPLSELSKEQLLAICCWILDCHIKHIVSFSMIPKSQQNTNN